MGPPCVAHRVCPIDAVAAGSGCVSISCTRFASLPDFFANATASTPGATSATPAES
ncbi:Uncharacterised protein [Mycobacteroides abscessus]|nr:Uncharacterised protein [Mycobacteroides abscessus]